MRGTIKTIIWLSLVAACSKEETKTPEATKPTTTDKTLAAQQLQKPEGTAEKKVVSVTTTSPEARAAFERAQALLDNSRDSEARPELEKAIAADPDFAYAHALLGTTIPGAEGASHIEKAMSLSANLPEAERLSIERIHAQRTGEYSTVPDLVQRLVQAAPDDWRVHNFAGYFAWGNYKDEDAIASFEKALALNPKAAQAYNGLAYVRAQQRNWEPAIEAARKQAELLPSEPNPQDTYAEILLWSGKLDEAEAAFKQALERAPQFFWSWQGIALARAFRGDYAGAEQAYTSGLQAIKQPAERISFHVDAAWIALAAGKNDAAMKHLSAAEKEAQQAKLPAYAGVALERARIFDRQGKYKEACAQVKIAKQRIDDGDFPGGAKKNITMEARFDQLKCAARLGKAADADALLPQIEAALKDEPNQEGVKRAMAVAQGMAALAKGDAAGAATAFQACNRDDYWCTWERAAAQEKAGDATAAATTRAQIIDRYYRGADFAYLLAQLNKKGGPAAKGTKEP